MKGVFNEQKFLLASLNIDFITVTNDVKIEDPYNTKLGDHLQTNYTSQYSYFL